MRVRQIAVGAGLSVALLATGHSSDVTPAEATPWAEPVTVSCEDAHAYVATKTAEIERSRQDSLLRVGELQELRDDSKTDGGLVATVRQQLAAEQARLAGELRDHTIEWAAVVVDNAMCFPIRDRVEASGYID